MVAQRNDDLREQVMALIQKAQPLPSEVSPRLYGNQNHEALFSFYVDDIISLMTTGGSPLMQWMPSEGVDYWNEPVAHLSWVAPEGFTGATTYADFKANQDPIEECDFGDGTVYNICEYMHTMARMSWSTRSEPIKQEDNIKLWKRQPTYVLRGMNQGITLANDRDWSLARLAIMAEEDHNWNIIYGDELVYPNSYLGLNNIITTGFVKGRAKNRGSCDFTDPVVIPGTTLSTNTEIIRKVNSVAKRIIRRMTQRGSVPSGDDMVIVLNDVQWDYLSQTMAWGIVNTFNPPDGISLQATTEAIARELQRIRTGGLGYGTWRVGNYDIPVIPETRIGSNTTTADDEPAVTGDIFVLTKRFRGITVLMHQYIKWSLVSNDSPMATLGFNNGEYKPQFFQNDMIRVVPMPVTTNWLCWFYGADMYGRIVSKMNMLQGRVNDVTVVTEMVDENESVSFTSQEFYAFNGEYGGQGTDLLVPLN